MSRADAGVFFSTTSLFLVATTLGQLGTDLGLVYFLSRSRALQRFGDIGDYLRAALWPVAAVSAGARRRPAGRRAVAGPGHQRRRTRRRPPTTCACSRCSSCPRVSAARCWPPPAGSAPCGRTSWSNRSSGQMAQVLLVAAVVTRAQWIVALAWSLPYLVWLVAAYLDVRPPARRLPRPGGDERPRRCSAPSGASPPRGRSRASPRCCCSASTSSSSARWPARCPPPCSPPRPASSSPGRRAATPSRSRCNRCWPARWPATTCPPRAGCSRCRPPG